MTQYTKNEPSSIRALFNTIANQYDLANCLMSFGLHALWNKKLVHNTVNTLQKEPCVTILDLCAGTGDIAFRFPQYKTLKIQALHLLDFSHEMIAIAKKRGAKNQEPIFYHEGDAQQLPFKNNTFSAITMAYGIRNIQNPKKCLMECRRVLKIGGTLAILELTRPKNSILQHLHTLFLRTYIPLIGKLITKDKAAYNYLKSSVLQFLSPEELIKIAEDIGFTKIKIEPLSGGIATLYLFTN